MKTMNDEFGEEFGEDIFYNPDYLMIILGEDSLHPINTPYYNQRLYRDVLDFFFTASSELYINDCPLSESITHFIDIQKALFFDYGIRITENNPFRRLLLMSDWFINTCQNISNECSSYYSKTLDKIEKSDLEVHLKNSKGRIDSYYKEEDPIRKVSYNMILGTVRIFIDYCRNQELCNRKTSLPVIPYNIWGDEYENKRIKYQAIPLHSLDDEGQAVLFEPENVELFKNRLSYAAYLSSRSILDGDEAKEKGVREFETLFSSLYLDYVGRATKVPGISKKEVDICCFNWYIKTIQIIYSLYNQEDDRPIECDPEYTFYYGQCLSMVNYKFSRFVSTMKTETIGKYSIEYSFKNNVDLHFEELFRHIKLYYPTAKWKDDSGIDLNEEDFRRALIQGDLSLFYVRGAITALRYTVYRLAPYAEEGWVESVAKSIGVKKNYANGREGWSITNGDFITKYPIPEMSKK